MHFMLYPPISVQGTTTSELNLKTTGDQVFVDTGCELMVI